MTTYDLSLHRRVRIWWEEFPEAYCCSTHNTPKSVVVCHSQIFPKEPSKVVVIEALLPKGARYLYGLLGARYEYQGEENLIVQIWTESGLSKAIKYSLIAELEPTYLGLPPTYVTEVIRGVETAQQESQILGPGTLKFCYAAHGLVSSNSFIFKQLSFMVVNLLGFQDNTVSTEQLEKMMK